MALSAGGIFIPNLIVRPVFAGTAVIVDNSGDKVISLANACFCRPFSIASWSTLRFGMRVAMNGSATINTSPEPIFTMGVQSGNSTQVFDSNTTNAFVLHVSANSWTFSSGSTGGYSLADGFSFPASKINNTYTNESTRFVGARYIGLNTDTNAPCMVMCEIFKGSPNWKMKMFWPTGSNFIAISRDTFLSNMVATTPSGTGYTYEATFSATGVAFSESGGTIDNITVGWSRSEATMEITDIAVVKFA